MLVAGLCFAQFRSRPRADFPGYVPGSGHLVRIEGGLIVNEDEIAPRAKWAPQLGNARLDQPAGFPRMTCSLSHASFFKLTRGRAEPTRFRWLGWWWIIPMLILELFVSPPAVTSIKTDPDARVIKLTDPGLALSIALHGACRLYALRDDEVDACANIA